LEKQLLLHFSQAEKALSKARNNNYSDSQKQAYQKSLFLLLKAMRGRIDSSAKWSPNEIADFKNEINFIFKSLEFLGSSILNLIPYEVVSCLDKALADWTPIGQKFVIVTSLVNNAGAFGFDPSLAQNEAFYSYLFSKYKIAFDGRLVQINIPKTLSRDYLISGIHYHELGHFVDSKYSITNSVTKVLFNSILQKQFPVARLAEIVNFLPALNQVLQGHDPNQVFHICQNHIAEYFCDLFASQYVGDSSANHLQYIAGGQGASFSHPATQHRITVVSNFLSGTSNIVVEILNDALMQIVGKKLEIRHENVDESDFYQFLPPIIENDRQLHGIFAAAVRVWRSDWGAYGNKVAMGQSEQSEKLYTIINNLIEKSIGNYIVTQKWNEQRQQAMAGS
jgi:hypothetical protein